MRHIKDIHPLNKAGRRHGFWKAHDTEGVLWYLGTYDKDIQIGYWHFTDEYHKKFYLDRGVCGDHQYYINT